MWGKKKRKEKKAGCHLPRNGGRSGDGVTIRLLIKWMDLVWIMRIFKGPRLSKLFPKLSNGHLQGRDITGDEV